jgi:hypothetical protein
VRARSTPRARRIALCAATALTLALSCSADQKGPGDLSAGSPDQRHGAPASREVDIRQLSVSGDLPILTLAGARGRERIVFLHGMCSKPDEYLRSFRFAAARVGRTVALQGDSECSGDRDGGRTWSRDIDRLDRRIEKAWRATGEKRPLRDLIVVGYSLGAVRAEALAKLNPDRYSQLVLIGGPKRPGVRGLRELEAAVMVAGERDRQAPMKAGQRELEAVGVPAIFLPLPEAAHGEMGPDAERVMSRAFEFLRSTTGELGPSGAKHPPN